MIEMRMGENNCPDVAKRVAESIQVGVQLADTRWVVGKPVSCSLLPSLYRFLELALPLVLRKS